MLQPTNVHGHQHVRRASGERGQARRAGVAVQEHPATAAARQQIQCAAVTLVLAARARPDWACLTVPLTSAAAWTAWAAVIATAWSGLEYLWAARSLVR